MTKCTQESFEFPACKRRVVEADFRGGQITSDGGALLLRQVDHRLGLCAAVAAVLEERRRRGRCGHTAPSYEDLNDHDELRRDLAIQTAVDRDMVLASSSTLCCWENRPFCWPCTASSVASKSRISSLGG